ncbi:MAG: SDR family oxidoreductase [Waltera sp.]
MLDSNVTAYYRLVKEFLPLLAPGSRIVLIGSTSGIRRDRGGIYGISKWALRSYAYALREECKPMGIGVSLINPGGTFTETRKKSSEEDRSLLETSDLGKVITLTFRLSPQAVLEEVNIRPLQGDTY